MSGFRLFRFLKWYRRLRRDPLDKGFTDWQMPRRFALSVAWYWSSDVAAFIRAYGRGP